MNVIDPEREKIRLTGSPDDRTSLLQTMQVFVRGTLTTKGGGDVYREKCAQDEEYEAFIDRLVDSGNVYAISHGAAALCGGGHFDPQGPNQGGFIVIEKNYSRQYNNGSLWNPQVFTHTTSSVLAHELGHAISHVSGEKYSDQHLRAGSPGKRKAEGRARHYSVTPYERMHMDQE